VRLTLINQFYRPDISPTAQLSASLAEHRARLGDRVTVITSSARYVAPAGAAHSRPTPKSNPRVLRLWTPSLGKATIATRLLEYASYYLLALWHAVALPRQDVIVSLTTPPYIAFVAVLHKMLHRRAKVVLWNMDCYPDVIERACMIRKGGLLSRVLRAMNRALFRQVDHLVCLDTAMVDLLCSQYAAGPGRPAVSVIPNWEDLSVFPPDARPQKWAAAGEAGAGEADGRFVLLYLGNTGVGHPFETVLDAAEQMRGDNVRFVFVGGGSRWKAIRDAKEARKLNNVLLHDYVPKEQTPSVMAAADAALITLGDEALGVMSPSKLHSNLAMGLPVVYVGPEGSNVDDAIRRFGCGVSLRHGDVQGLVSHVRRLAGDAKLRDDLRGRARRAFDEAYCDTRTLPQFDRVIASVATSHQGR
jgi:colanic acid biosynthesis glycosyl transferase WcaI